MLIGVGCLNKGNVSRGWDDDRSIFSLVNLIYQLDFLGSVHNVLLWNFTVRLHKDSTVVKTEFFVALELSDERTMHQHLLLDHLH